MSSKVVVYEKAFLGVGAVLLVACLCALLYASVAMGIEVPGKSGEIDPMQVSTTPPFDQPGVRDLGDNRYEVVVVGRAWRFEPAEIRIPVGAEVTFTTTSADVLHGFNIEATRVNMMLVPGQITQMQYSFDEPGEHLIICHEYCGIGHHTMYGTVIVE